MLLKRLKAKARRFPSYAKHQVIDVFEDNEEKIYFLKQKIVKNEFEVVIKELKSCILLGKSKLFKEIIEIVGLAFFEKNAVSKSIIYCFEESDAVGAVECLEFFCSFICKHKAFDLILGSSGHAKGRSIGSLGSGDFLCHEDNWCHPMAMLSLSNLLVQVILDSKDLHEAAATLRACCFEWLDVEFGDKKTGATMLQMSTKMLGEHPVWLYPIERPCALDILSKKGFKKSGAILLSVLGEERFKSLRYLYGNESLAHLAARELDVYAWQYCLDNHIGFPGKEAQEDLNYKEIKLKTIDLQAQEIECIDIKQQGGLINNHQNSAQNFDDYLYTVLDGYLRSQDVEGNVDSGWEWISKHQLSPDGKAQDSTQKQSLSAKWIDTFTKITLSEVQHLKMKDFSNRVYRTLQKTCDDCLEEYSFRLNENQKNNNEPGRVDVRGNFEIKKEALTGCYVHPLVVLSEQIKKIDENGGLAKKNRIIELMLSEALNRHMYPPKNTKDWQLFWGNLNEQNKSFVEKVFIEGALKSSIRKDDYIDVNDSKSGASVVVKEYDTSEKEISIKEIKEEKIKESFTRSALKHAL